MTAITVFGTKPQDAIFLPPQPFAVRLNCQAGQVALSEDEFLSTSLEISIIKVARYFGDLGKTKQVEWLQIFFVVSPTCKVLPANTVCVSYIKTRSLSQFAQTITRLMENGEPAEGIFILSFQSHQNTQGQPYKSVKFDWRERKTAVEKKQLELIAAFMQNQPALADTNGTRDMVCIDGMTVTEVQQMVSAVKE
ncbi:hypothetical protein V2H45_18445 [Tumidithrix elongata RA019]|uniref:Uncharacterized protein n=1 Tax=Tumidithrix elongata BACA0141 TaxID=2716417 RepID=A0AAW9Q713_9CYAN|nr:hypothetical protein [Tumidithrix elongata RA019]